MNGMFKIHFYKNKIYFFLQKNIPKTKYIFLEKKNTKTKYIFKKKLKHKQTRI